MCRITRNAAGENFFYFLFDFLVFNLFFFLLPLILKISNMQGIILDNKAISEVIFLMTNI